MEVDEKRLTKPKRPLGEKTRQRILEVSLRLFAAQGYHKTSITQIVKGAQTYRAAIEWHFGGKEGVLLAVLDHFLKDKLVRELRVAWENFLIHTDQMPQDQAAHLFFLELSDLLKSNLGIILALFIFTFERIHSNPVIGERIRRGWSNIYDVFQWMIETRTKARGVENELEPKIMARIMVAQAQGTFVQYYLEPNPENAEKLFAQLMTVFKLLFSPVVGSK